MHVVVHDDLPSHGATQASLFFPLDQTAADVIRAVPPGHQPLSLYLGGRGHEQHDDGVRTAFEHLAGSLDIDLEQHVVARRWTRQRGAVQVPQELGPLEEAALGDPGLEGIAADEGVRISFLTRSAPARRPRAAEPEVRDLPAQALRDGALPGTARADEDEDERLGGQWVSGQSL